MMGEQVSTPKLSPERNNIAVRQLYNNRDVVNVAGGRQQ